MVLHYTLTFIFFFFNDTATTEIYTLSLHDALPILAAWRASRTRTGVGVLCSPISITMGDRKSTRLNSSHSQISYAVFCLKKKKNKYTSVCRYVYTCCQQIAY